MDVPESWKQCFARWPDDLPRRGLVVTTFNEQIPFQGFMTSETAVLLERTAPDALGARLVVIPFAGILALKITEVAKPRSLNALGFDGALMRK